MHIRITIDIVYDETSIFDEEELMRDLRRGVDRAVQRGLLTPSLEEIVDEYTVNIDETTHPDDKYQR